MPQIALGKRKAEDESECKKPKLARIEPHMHNEPSPSGLSGVSELSAQGHNHSLLLTGLASSLELNAAWALYKAMWGEPVQGILQTVAHGRGTGLKYVPSAKLEELKLQFLGFTERVLLFRQEYVDAFDSLELKSPMQCADSVIVTGHPGIGMNFPLITAMSDSS